MEFEIKKNPEYVELPLLEFKGNPLVEALNPPVGTHKEAVTRLKKRPDFDECELSLMPSLRQLLPPRLLEFICPTSQHVKIMGQIYSQVISGYRHRNPNSAQGQRVLHGESTDASNQAEEGLSSCKNSKCSDFILRPGALSLLTGLSGMGKSTLIRAIMRSLGSPVIMHSQYKDQAFTESQIVYMMRNVPDQCNAKELCMSFGSLADEMLGKKLYSRPYDIENLSSSEYVRSLRDIIINHHVGAIVIDEFQNISYVKSGGKDEVLRLIHNLRDELGVPIILVGTYAAAALLKNNVNLARRISEGGFYELKRPLHAADEDWLSLCNIIWKYQWVTEQKDISDEIIQTLFDCSQGITGIMLSIYVTAQTHAISEDIEVITPKLIKDVYQDRFRPLHDIIHILRGNNPEVLAKYDDLYSDAMKILGPGPCNSRMEVIQKQIDSKMTELIESKKTDGQEPKTAKPRQKGKEKPSIEDLQQALKDTGTFSSGIFK